LSQVHFQKEVSDGGRQVKLTDGKTTA